jgi:hypothetical protein
VVPSETIRMSTVVGFVEMFTNPPKPAATLFASRRNSSPRPLANT